MFIDCDINDAPSFDSTVLTQAPSGTAPYTDGDTLTYSCLEPTQDFSGANIVTCQSDGTWLPSMIGSCSQTSKTSDTNVISR